jgi:putative tricarboxylic transport membrane protein
LLNRLKHKRDFYAGGLMVLVGLGTVLEARSYNLGTLTHMGPGFFPIMLGAALIIVGVMIAGSATASGENDGTLVLPQPEWRGWLCIIAGPILFIVLGHYGGLIPATFSCVFVSALGDRSATLKGSLILAVAVTVFSALLFSYVLHVPFPPLRWVPSW